MEASEAVECAALFRQVFQHSRDAIVVAEAPSGRILLWNPAAEALFGYTAQEAVGQPVEFLISDALRPHHQAGLRQYGRSGRGRYIDSDVTLELVARRKSGDEIRIELSLSPFRPAGGARLAVAICRDITARKRLEQGAQEGRHALAEANADLERLTATLQRRVEERTRELTEANAKLRRLVETDALTGLANRRHALETMERFLALAKRQGRPLSVAYIDFDHFKRVNDRHGHPVGDSVLRRAGELLANSFRGQDVVARWGGEEFLIMMFGIGKQDAAVRLRSVLQILNDERFSSSNGRVFHVSFSAGVAAYPHDGQDVQSLYAIADQALYRAKELGRNRVVVASGLGTAEAVG